MFPSRLFLSATTLDLWRGWVWLDAYSRYVTVKKKKKQQNRILASQSVIVIFFGVYFLRRKEVISHEKMSSDAESNAGEQR